MQFPHWRAGVVGRAVKQTQLMCLFKLFCEYMEDKYGELDTLEDYVLAVRYTKNCTWPPEVAWRFQSFGQWIAWEELGRGEPLRPRRIRRPFPVVRSNRMVLSV